MVLCEDEFIAAEIIYQITRKCTQTSARTHTFRKQYLVIIYYLGSRRCWCYSSGDSFVIVIDNS